MSPIHKYNVMPKKKNDRSFTIDIENKRRRAVDFQHRFNQKPHKDKKKEAKKNNYHRDWSDFGSFE